MSIGKRHALLWGPLFLFIVAFVLHVNQMYVMFSALMLLAPASYLLGRRKLNGLTATRHSRGVMTAGERSPVLLTVRNEGRLRQFFLGVRDSLPEGLESAEGGAVFLPDLSPGTEQRVQYSLLARRRGVYRVGPLMLEGSDYLGLYKFTRRVGETSELLVYPRPLPIPNLWRRSLRGRAPQQSRRHRMGEDGSFFGVRDYVPGDDLRRVDWKTSARRGHLAVIQSEETESTEAVVLLDLSRASHAGQGERSTIEYAATLAASLAAEALGRGASVGLLAVGAESHSVPGSTSPRQALQILEALARVKADGSHGLLTVVKQHERFLPKACGVAVISADLSADLLAALMRLTSLGHAVTWFALAPHTFRPQPGRDEQTRYERSVAQAAAHGASVVRVLGDAPLEASLTRRGHHGRRA